MNKGNLRDLLLLNNALNARNMPRPGATTRLGRTELDAVHQIDWDDTPTIYASTTMAYGHLLQYKQQWIAGDYYFGDMIYSLPLALGQKNKLSLFIGKIVSGVPMHKKMKTKKD
ncbi:MAG: hypothetical protein EOP48_01590 [Sphingobacteriales bacterium]|nr:MAG: hypothetical protein EOP48_01590 [Sphingobacteriales bacterium]